MMDQFTSFGLGVLASIVAAYLYAKYAHRVIQTRHRSLEGWWFEVIPMSPERSFSMGRFVFDPKTNSYSYDGENYQNDGSVFCTWQSVSVRVDQASRQLFYIFRASVKNASHVENHGFGVIAFGLDRQGDPVPESGYYIEAKENGVPFTHTMQKLDDVARDLGLSIGPDSEDQFRRRIVMEYQRRHPLSADMQLSGDGSQGAKK